VAGSELVMALSHAELDAAAGGASLRASVAALDEVYESALRRALGE
jgi:hypothetical protein